MQKRLIAIGSYALFWMVFFILARLFFIAVQYEDASQNMLGELLATFWHGARLDLSGTGYYLLIPVLLAIPGLWIPGRWHAVFIRIYTWILIVFRQSLWSPMRFYTPIGGFGWITLRCCI